MQTFIVDPAMVLGDPPPAFEAVIDSLGAFGPYQRQIFILVSAFETPAAWAMLLPLFSGAQPNWYCADNVTPSNHSDKECGDDGHCLNIVFNDTFTSIVSQVRNGRWLVSQKSPFPITVNARFILIIFSARGWVLL